MKSVGVSLSVVSFRSFFLSLSFSLANMNPSTIVVMLGKEKENDRVKVDRYWPEEGERPLQFQQLVVSLQEKRYDPDLSIAVRRLTLSLLPEDPRASPSCRQVIHYQYEGWPDHGVPSSAAPIRQLVHIIEHERYNKFLVCLFYFFYVYEVNVNVDVVVGPGILHQPIRHL